LIAEYTNAKIERRKRIGENRVLTRADRRQHSTPRLIHTDSPPAHAASGRYLEEPGMTARRKSSDQATAIEFFADILADGEHGAEDDFYSRLCEATTRATSMRRVILFRYDSTRRRVRAAGSHGVDISIFADALITVESAPLAKRALELDRVTEASSNLEREVPADYVRILGLTPVVCAPITAGGRWLGAILADRGKQGPPIPDAEREALWILGKTAALATMARAATRQHERNRQLEHRLDLAREVHENVVQRLFGVSLALAPGRPPDESTRARSWHELQTSLRELRSALQRPLGRAPAATKRRCPPR
jgi:signal transduction histidine kinase